MWVQVKSDGGLQVGVNVGCRWASTWAVRLLQR